VITGKIEKCRTCCLLLMMLTCMRYQHVCVNSGSALAAWGRLLPLNMSTVMPIGPAPGGALHLQVCRKSKTLQALQYHQNSFITGMSAYTRPHFCGMLKGGGHSRKLRTP
jgi:hypothetical protein